jgi:hypothetical protein
MLAALQARLTPILADILKDVVEPDQVSLVVRGDPEGFITSVSPGEVLGPKLGDTLDFELGWVGAVPPADHDRAYVVELEAVADGQRHLGAVQVLFIVPGRWR